MAGGGDPIDPDEAAGLIPQWVATQGELNALEQANVLEASLWLASRRRLSDVLTDKFLRELHRRMFGKVWKWAGDFRRSDKNIGVEWHQVPVALRQLRDDVGYWRDHGTYPWDEFGARFHHRLVSIHCFANGNGRHARLATDALMRQYGQAPFTWGAPERAGTREARRRYLDALRVADGRDYRALIAFVRS